MSARRAAHHIGHLLRAERVAAASSWYRNTDAGDAPQLTEPLSQPLHLILDNVRSAYNVGSIFRTADTAAVTEVVTCGFTPHPPHPKLKKTGFGAVDAVCNALQGDHTAHPTLTLVPALTLALTLISALEFLTPSPR